MLDDEGLAGVHFMALVYIAVDIGANLILVDQIDCKMHIAVLFLSAGETKLHL